MIVIKAKSVYNVDTISAYNDNAWKLIDAAVDECLQQNPGEKVVVDFKDINLLEPWVNTKFREFMAKRTADLVLYNSKDVANYLKTMCITGGMGSDRVKDVTISSKKGKTREEILIEQKANEWQDIFFPGKAPDIAVIKIKNRIDQISSARTINYIEQAILLYNKRNPGVNKFILQTDNMSVEAHSVEAIGELIVTLQQRDKLFLKLQNNDHNVETNSRMFAALKSQGEYDARKRVEAIMKYLKADRPGLLMAYAKSRSVDRMGRSGNGEIRSCQPAIFLGLGKSSEGPVMKFRVYQLDKFYTRVHWALEHDGEGHNLVSREVEIPVNNCGLYGIYLGKDYHFSEPIQYRDGRENGTMMVLDTNERGNSVKLELTIPEFIQCVFDSYDIKYDKEYLSDCVKRTKKVIEYNKAKDAHKDEGSSN